MLHGRVSELERIDALLTGLASSRGGALVIEGEPGIGKTTLLVESRRRASGVRVAATTGVEAEADLPFAALVELAQPLLPALTELPDRQARALGAALALEAPATGQTDRLATFAGFLALLRAAAATTPLLLVVDDAQWIDLPSADCLAYAARRLDHEPVAVLAAARPDEGRARIADWPIDRVELAGLDPDDARALLRSQRSDLADQTTEALIELAGGNPLALNELPAHLTEEQRRGLQPIEPAPAPGGALGDALERRLAVASEATTRALVVASVSFGSRLGPLVAACDALGIDPKELELAESADLIEIDRDRIRFSHPLLRAVVHRHADPAERRRAHRALADVTGDEARGWHLAAAALGADAEAAAALDNAAQAAASRGAHGAAADALERAASLSEHDAERTTRLWAGGLAAAMGGDYERGVALLTGAAESTEPRMRAASLHLLAMVSLNGGVGTAIENHRLLAAEAERIAELDPTLAAVMHSDAGLAAVVAARCEDALRSAREADRLLPADAPTTPRCQVTSMLGMGRALAGETDAARQALDQAGALLGDVEAISPAAQSISFALGARFCTGQERLALQEQRGLVEAANAAGTQGLIPYFRLEAADCAYRLGEWDEAMSDLDEAVAIAEVSGQRGALSVGLVIRGRLKAARGAERPAREDLRRGMDAAEAPKYVSATLWGHAALGFLELGLERTGPAIEHLERTAEMAAAAGLRDPGIVPWATDLAEAYARAGRSDDARRLSLELNAMAERTGTPLAAAFAARCAALVDADADPATWARVVDAHEAAGLPLELARAQLLAGSSLHRRGHRVEARTALRAARAAFAQLGADPWARLADSELRAAGGVDRKGEDQDELTAQELRIALAVARGATNREVAEALFLSPKTIEFHLSRVYRKLGIRSRTELAALVADGKLADAAREPAR